MSIRFFFVRHGQAEANLRDDYYNDEKSGLTDLGKAQAAKAGSELKKYGVNFKAIFCSPYRRAIETCRIAMLRADLHGVLATVDERIGERKFDGLIGCKISKEHNQEICDYNSTRSFFDGIETLDAVERRAQAFVNDVSRNYHDGDFLVFSHGIFGLVFRAVLEGRPKSGSLFEWDLLKNGEIMVLEVAL